METSRRVIENGFDSFNGRLTRGTKNKMWDVRVRD